MAESVVSFLLNQLSVLVREEHQLLGGLEQEVEYIQNELGQMRVFLRVADAKEESNPNLKEWVRQLREISYDVQDVLDKYMLRFRRRGGTNGFSGWIRKVHASIKNLKARHQIASEIQAIKYRLENVSKSKQRYKEMYDVMDQGSSSTIPKNEWYDGRGDALFLEEDDVVGIEGPKKQLLEWIWSMDNALEVISVVGMGGLGKTTLVKKVYDDVSVKLHSDHYVWITVSESFKVESLLENMIKQLVGGVKQPPPQGLEAMSTDDMKEFIYKFLENKTYLIVIDDIWKISAWEAIRYAFPRSTARGCIIITTRFNSIANAACTDGNGPNGHVYNLEPLPAEESKKLFYQKAFRGNSCPHYLKEISESILKRCEGLPLAIVVIGGLLATKNNITEEWEMFNRSLGHELEGDNLMRITKILSLSYYDLPYYLKSCFLYLSMFREDSLLDKWRLIRLWIAEGFVHAKEGKTLEEVGEGYLNGLLNRSLVKVAQTSLDGRPKKFRVHDLLRQFIISKSREQNIVIIASGKNTRLPNKVRRLAIHSPINYTQETYTFEHLSSLFLSESVGSEMEPIIYKILCGGCRLLKVLKLIGSPLETIPDAVFKLYHLKFLSLRRTKVKVIPRAIEDLVNLEALDLKHTKVAELPIEILKLHKLRNILLYSYKGSYPHIPYDSIQSFHAPYMMGRLCSLQKLCYIEADQVAGSYKIVTEIGKLTQLRRLGITKLKKEDGKDLCSSLAKLTNLRSLYIFSIEETEVMDLQYSLFPSSLAFLRKLELHGRLEKFPPWISSLHGLTILFLGWSRLIEDPLESLQDLPNLGVLWIDCAYEGEVLEFKKGGFQRLKEVGLRKLSGLKWVRVEKGSMPRLEEMYILNCKSMAEMPIGVEHLTGLQRVEFSDMSEEFVERVARKGEDWKLAHVPRVGVLSFLHG